MTNFKPGDLVKLVNDVEHWNDEAFEKYTIVLYSSKGSFKSKHAKCWAVFVLFWKWKNWDNPSQVIFVAEEEMERVE